ncbi:MAG: MFS transporter, partial [Verrucomicrobiae bacterium]|nr:MFS transporter [Verrucomicrobiae bacterium]
YLEATSGLNGSQLSFIAAAVLLGSAISTMFAGLLADWMGRKTLMFISGLLFVLSIPSIALAHGYMPLVLGRLLQGVSAGLIGVVVPLYLAECLGAANRGKGTAMFQWLLTLGLVAAAGIGFWFSLKVADIEKLNDLPKLFAFKDTAWRSIFWVSLPPGILFVIGSLLVAESPRWLFRQGRKDDTLAALLRSRSQEQAETELKEMEAAAAAASVRVAGPSLSESLFSRKYVLPFVLACIILACNQATGVNSIIIYNPSILIQAGLSDAHAHLGYVILTVVNFLVTMVGVALVDKKGRKFLLSVGSAGIIVSLICTGLVFNQTEKQRVEVKAAVQTLVVQSNQTATVEFNAESAARLLGKTAAPPSTLVVIYSYGDFTAASKVVRSDDIGAKIEINRAGCLPPNKVAAFFQNPFASLDKSRTAPLEIKNALVTPVPPESTGWLTAVCIFTFMAFFAMGPGVCVWLALSELMPTRIRSNGMSAALLVNQAVSTFIAAVFLPSVGEHGYAMMFFIFAGCTVVYFITATFFLPETKGKTLEEIEAHFEGKK